MTESATPTDCLPCNTSGDRLKLDAIFPSPRDEASREPRWSPADHRRVDALLKDAFDRAVQSHPELVRPLWQHLRDEPPLFEEHDPDGQTRWVDSYDLRDTPDFGHPYPTTQDGILAAAIRRAREACRLDKVSSPKTFARTVEYYRLEMATLIAMWPLVTALTPALEQVIAAPTPRHLWEYLDQAFWEYIGESNWTHSSEANFLQFIAAAVQNRERQ